MTPEQLAHRKMEKELERRTSQSIFQANGELRHDASEMSSSGQIHLGEYLHLEGIEWAPEPNGSEHCIQLSRLAKYIAELPEKLGGIVGGPMSIHEQNVLHAVAMLYCTGMKGGVVGYEARSADFADTFFRKGGGAGTYWSKTEVREDVCRLIYKHNDDREVRADKRLQVFSDALRYESVRFKPNTPEGLALIRERLKPELLFTGWAKEKENFRGWMIARGWR